MNKQNLKAMNAFSEIHDHESEDPVLELIDMAWGFRIRPADMESNATDAIAEWGLTVLGIAFLFAAFGQWVLPGSLYTGDALMIKFVLTCILGLAGGVTLSVSARGFRPEVQIDRSRHEIRFVSRNPRGRGQVLATVDLEQIIGVGKLDELSPRRRKTRIARGGRAPVPLQGNDGYPCIPFCKLLENFARSIRRCIINTDYFERTQRLGQY